MGGALPSGAQSLAEPSSCVMAWYGMAQCGLIECAVYVRRQVVTSRQLAPPAVRAAALMQCGANKGKHLPQSTNMLLRQTTTHACAASMLPATCVRVWLSQILVFVGLRKWKWP